MPDYPAAMNLAGSALASNVGASVASAATVTITSAITPVTGTAAVSLVKIPAGFRGAFVLIPAGACTTVTGGTYAGSDGVNESIPWAVAVTCVANKALLCVTDGLKVYPLLTA